MAEVKDKNETKEKTVRVEITECVAGHRFVHKPGKQYDLPAKLAAQYIAAELAVRVSAEEPAK